MSEVKDYPPHLDYPKPRKKETNGDRIRSMNDEELAKMFDGWIQDCGCNAVPCHKNCHITDGKSCMMRWLDWLRREVTDD